MVYSCVEKTGSELGPMTQPYLWLAVALPVWRLIKINLQHQSLETCHDLIFKSATIMQNLRLKIK